MAEKKKTKGESHSSIGGQAVMEGVMLKSDNNLVICARNQKGKIECTSKRLKGRKGWHKWFFIRGIVNLVDMLKIGMEALAWSGNVASDDDEKISVKEWVSIVLISILFVVGFFVVLPFFATKLITADKGVLFNIIDGALRIIFFILYIVAISASKDIKRVFQYHGAEHKVVNCYEDLKDVKKVTPSNCKRYSPIHVRCGSSFLMIVLIISIIVFSLITSQNTWVRLGSRVILLPVIVGLSYEFLKFSAKHHKNIIMKAIMWPGLALQSITTKEPSKRQLEVGIATFKKLMAMEKR